jgi:hypothetical protein
MSELKPGNMNLDDDEDDVMKEIRAKRAAFAATHDNDILKMGDALREQQMKSGLKFVNLREQKWQETLQEEVEVDQDSSRELRSFLGK